MWGLRVSTALLCSMFNWHVCNYHSNYVHIKTNTDPIKSSTSTYVLCLWRQQQLQSGCVEKTVDIWCSSSSMTIDDSNVDSYNWACTYTCYIVPRTHSKFGERAFAYAGPAATNRLPDHIRRQSTPATFTTHLKMFLFVEVFLHYPELWTTVMSAVMYLLAVWLSSNCCSHPYSIALFALFMRVQRIV